MRRISDALNERGIESIPQLSRLAFARFVYRDLCFIRTGVRAGDAVAPNNSPGLRLEVWGREGFERAAAANEYIRPGDLELFRAQPTSVAVALDGDAVVAQVWGTTGRVPADELGVPISTLDDEVYTCRGVVLEDYRGRSLLGHVMFALTSALDPDVHTWDLIRDRNTASLIGVARHGRLAEGRYVVRYVFGRPRLTIERHAPRRISIPAAPAERAACVIVAEQSWGSPLRAANALHADGVPVAVASVGSGSSIYRSSRYCTAAADFSPEGFGQALTAWVDRVFPEASAVTLIPTSDRTLELVTSSSFGPRIRRAGVEDTRSEELLDKRSAFAVAERAGLDVPMWVPVDDEHPFDASSWEAFPVTVRPTSWKTVGSDPIKVVRCDTRERLASLVAAQRAAGAELIVQAFVEHREGDVAMAITWSDGVNHSICTGRKRRESHADGGVMVWGVAESIPEIERAARAFLDETGVMGPGGLEFIFDGSGWKFIEFNPRLEAVQFLAEAAGHNTVVYEHRRLAGADAVEELAPQRPAAAWVGSAALLRAQADGSPMTVLRDRVAFALQKNRVRAIWTWKDPMPGINVVRHNLSMRFSTRHAGEGAEAAAGGAGRDLRVLHVINALGVGGGAEHSLAQMVPMMTDLGVHSEVLVLTPREAGLEHGLREAGIAVNAVAGSNLVSRIRSVRSLLRSGRFDLVHVSLYESSIIARLASIGTGVPVLNSFVNTSYDPVRTSALAVSPWKLRVVREIDRLTARFVDHAHALTGAASDEARDVLGIDPDRITVVPRGRSSELLGEPGVERRERVRARLGIDDNALIVLNVGRQDAQKAQAELVEAFSQVRAALPTARLLIAGRTGDATADLTAAIERTAMGEAVELLGHRDDVADLLAACDVFVFPSKYEGLGCSLIEAMALGAPIIGSDAPAIAEVLRCGELGVVVPRGDIDALAVEIRALLESPERRERLARGGIDEFQARYRLERVVADMVELYRNVTPSGARS